METYGPHCFSETDTFGVSFAAGASETASSDKNELDNIAISDYTFDARVTAIKFCTDLRTNYLSSVQAGSSNGYGNKIKWMSTIGHDETIKAALVNCKTYEVERSDYRIAEMEIGSLNTGVTWLNIVVRDVRLKSPSPSDVVITVGSKAALPATMLYKSLQFDTKKSPFVGFTGTTTSNARFQSIYNLGGVSFGCWEDLNTTDAEFKENLDNFYQEYEGFVWLLSAILLLIITGCVVCGIWINDSASQIRRLKHEKEMLAIIHE